MKKPNSVAMLASALFNDGRIYDETAETALEIHASAKQFGITTIRRKIDQKLKSGLLEQVWKRDERGQPCKAYRIKRIK